MQFLFAPILRLVFAASLLAVSSSASANFSHLWGVGFIGGNSDLGYVYRVDSGGANKEIVHHFAGGEDGQYPRGDLILGLDGQLYGLASGGENSQGIDFSF